MEGGLRANQGASPPGVDASGQPTRLPCGSNLAGPGECVCAQLCQVAGQAQTDGCFMGFMAVWCVLG